MRRSTGGAPVVGHVPGDRLQGVPAGEVVSLRIECQWPAKELNPNRRPFWRVVAKHRKAQRDAAHYSTLAAIPVEVRRKLSRCRPLPVSLRFLPPNKMRRDVDNLLASCKGMLDGIADALQTDDAHFQITLDLRKDEPVKGGLVIVEVGT
jgi:crossover junction endodeoxyribonuclease RusA